MVRLFSRSRRSCNPCKSEIIQATQTAVDVSAQAENKVSNLQEDVIVNTGGIAANRVTAQNALTQAGDALVAAQQAQQTAQGVSAVADNAITLATDAQAAVEAVEDELTAIQNKNTQQDTDIRDLQQDYIDTDAHLTAVETDLEGHETNYNNPHRVTAAQLGLGSAVNYKGQVTNYADLPTAGNTKGDMYNVVNAYLDYPAHSNVIWDGSQWDNTGGVIDLSNIEQQISTLSGTVASNKTAVDTEINGIKTLNTTQTQQITALQTGKQDKLTAGAGIAINNGVITATGYSGEVDTALSTTSTNPVTNKAITEAINGKQAVGNYATVAMVNTVASDLAEAETTINGHITAADARLTNLEQSLSAVDQRVTANTTKNTQQDGTLTSLQSQINAKQNALTFDTTPTANSSNPVTSGGVYTALQGVGGGEVWEEVDLNNWPTDWTANDRIKVMFRIGCDDSTRIDSWTTSITTAPTINSNYINPVIETTLTGAQHFVIQSKTANAGGNKIAYITVVDVTTTSIEWFNSSIAFRVRSFWFNQTGGKYSDLEIGVNTSSGNNLSQYIYKMWRLKQ